MPKTKPRPYRPTKREIEAAVKEFFNQDYEVFANDNYTSMRRALIAANKVREGMKNG